MGSFLNPSPIERGMGQGCPLSPFLFALVMEPLATALRQADSVKGIRIGSIEEKLALYADDLMLFLSDPRPSLRAALNIISGYTVLSGLRINWDKS